MAKKRNQNPKETVAARRDRLNAIRAEAEAKAKRIRNAIIGGAAALAVIVIAVFVYVFVAQGQVAALQSSLTPKVATAEKSGLTLYADKAKPDAPKVSVYADFHCSACKTFEEWAGQAFIDLAKSGDIALDYRMLFGTGGENSKSANMMGACIAEYGDSDQFAAFTKAVFSAGSDTFTDAQIASSFPEEASISGEVLTNSQKCFQDKLTLGFVEGVSEDAYKQNIQTTPSVTVNGKQAENLNGITQNISTADLLTWVKGQIG